MPKISHRENKEEITKLTFHILYIMYVYIRVLKV